MQEVIQVIPKIHFKIKAKKIYDMPIYIVELKESKIKFTLFLYNIIYTNIIDAEFVSTYTRYHALLRNCESRTKLWPITRTITETYFSQEYKIESSGWPEDFRRSLPLWTTLTTVTKGDQIEIID